MEYSLEICSRYNVIEANKKKIIIFDDHNMALPAWGTIRQDFDSPLRLVSFDTHADTRAPFAREMSKNYFSYDSINWRKFKKEFLSPFRCKADDFNFQDTFCLATELVANDEHILVADYYDYINEYIIFCGLSKDESEEFQRTDRLNGQNATYFTKHKIEQFSDMEIASLCNVPIILDFDLDYFTYPQMFNAVFTNKISMLIKHSAAITIAKEPRYFDIEKVDEHFTNEQALKLLLDLILEVCNAE